MRLLIDIGNSRVKWGTGEGEQIEGPFAFARGTGEPAATLEAAWGALRPDGIHWCSVADAESTEALIDWVRRRWRLAPVQVHAGGADRAVVTAYADPRTLGADRWANLLGARALLGPVDAIVADAGTAVTIDALRADGRHLGGAILPGLEAARAGLRAAAPALPVAGERTELPAADTAGAIAGGSLVGLAGAIERVAAEVGRSLERPAWLITGGDTDTLAPWLDPRWRADACLTLRGLNSVTEG